MASQPTTGPTVTPELDYGNARQAIEWLTEVLGLQHGLTVDGPDGSVVHAELWWHTGAVFVESLQPSENGVPTGTATVCLATESTAEVDSTYDRAEASGAEIVFELADTPFGSHQFAVRDPEGNIWTVGTYQPSVPHQNP
jgi:uncharacterized glyoxalase superfamily protein PhnB